MLILLQEMGFSIFLLCISIICGGFVSGLVIFGTVDMLFRAVINRSSMEKLFPGQSLNIANLVGVSSLFSMHYQQMCGQIMASLEFSERNGLMDIIGGRSERDIETIAGKMDKAVRRIDGLQVLIIRTTNRFVFQWSFIFWFFMSGLIAISIDTYEKSSNFIIDILGSIHSIALAGVLALLIAFASSVVACVTFSWLDRTAARR
ncbi:hypothetical protein [Amaricoccus sp. W119]|uniref:hypothetical protein n=1 Tax=Amaricoccus sp. W119 TaxID=3391833 RepID=UPI0039A53B31